MASTVDLLVVSPVKWLIKSEFEANCSKEQFTKFSQKYDELPDSTKLLAEILGDGVILGNTVKIFDIAKNSRVKIPSIEGSPKSLLAIEGGVSEISATSGVGKLSVDAGADIGKKISMVGEVEGLSKNIENVGSSNLWSNRPEATVVENAFSYWKRHGKNFTDTYNAKQYVEFAKNFIDHPHPNTLEYIRHNGEKIFYNPDSNIFIAATIDGVPKTMMKPRNKLKYWENKGE
ncbi:hypothetical protein [Candidatus Tisiphia endosymbiont of Dascillus cervinus]|uniref:hypothetical protein n=1 Tax=Candidatus Tisiphia endosymbiont of Dascillus cervinus TaxID=3066253 RepID=UPI00312C70D2